ncbi:YfiT family bacillithiol transferase [Paenibacillus dokdonensis]|uniref:YfiT family bacillithiol transferase n=1 Tax=Paenibacillus dokdonensis TaxID=2567944 RepID=UPI0010A7E02A|nr:putative metal-dependent hydrolase [Paenibacillus dokdonensis]
MNENRFPIGPFEPELHPSAEALGGLIHQIPEITKLLREMISSLPPEQQNIPYRQGGWTIKQVIHHMADNDMNEYIRFKKALTEDGPMAGSYREDLWAELGDYRDLPVESSLLFMEALHQRFVILLKSLDPDDFKKKLSTQVLGQITLETALQRFIWHSRHHIAQIQAFMRSDNGHML